MDVSSPAIAAAPRFPSPTGRARAAGWLILEARSRAGLTQQQLADRASVPQSTISVYERGRREPTLPMLERLVAATGFHVRLELVPAGLDLERNGRVLRDLLSLVDRIPSSRRSAELAYPRLPESVRR